MSLLSNTRARQFRIPGIVIILAVFICFALDAMAADIDRRARVDDASIKRDVAAKLVQLFRSRPADLDQIYDVKTGVFNSYKLFLISVYNRDLLEKSFMPDGGSLGMFAYGKDRLIYLNQGDNLEILCGRKNGGARVSIRPISRRS